MKATVVRHGSTTFLRVSESRSALEPGMFKFPKLLTPHISEKVLVPPVDKVPWYLYDQYMKRRQINRCLPLSSLTNALRSSPLLYNCLSSMIPTSSLSLSTDASELKIWLKRYQSSKTTYWWNSVIMLQGMALFPDQLNKTAFHLETNLKLVNKLVTAFNGIAYGEVYAGCNPVSYTHLDVYKRQT